MASSHDKGAAGDSMGTNNMSNFGQRRQRVYELSKISEITFKEALHEWSCDKIREMLRAESVKVRKYTGLTKDQIINRLYKTVSKKNTREREVEERNPSPKRQRKDPEPSHDVTPSAQAKGKGTIRCKNLACQAKLKKVDPFCKRCSCCICHKYDTNKDPSYWLTCTSDPSFDDKACGLSCHLECAFKSDKSGILEYKETSDVDGCFICVSCGTPSSILECVKKQLVIAKEERRIGVLYIRLLLAKKLLKGTKKYKAISEDVEKAVEELKTEFRSDPLTDDDPSYMSRGLVNRLRCAMTVKQYCFSALKALIDGSFNIRFVDVLASSVTLVIGAAEESSSRGTTDVHYSVWHRKVTEQHYPEYSTCKLFSPNTRFVVSGLTPATDYCFKVVSSRGAKELSVSQSNVSTKTVPEDEAAGAAEALLTLSSSSTNCNNFSTPQPSLNADKVEDVAGCISFGFEKCVKLIRQLECSGQVTTEFRQKFLTWYSVCATAKDKYVVKIFLLTFKEDTEALAEQLIDTFSDCISRKRHAVDGGGI
ncbi:PREDICTED: VIN3-like protein 3 [Camelina sativa]|uniref:VIN3-like protein 3 n=1 Tax=Camelina sativa TaxID=90675 RepID=A0ABM0XSN9_CAMSA|nr:PREDICTED: VIN3-like protein 3 [Camelina sativa]